jgi:hypothetical protein
VDTARRIIAAGVFALLVGLVVAPASAQVPGTGDVQDTANDAQQTTQDAVNDVQDTANDAQQTTQDAVNDVQDTAGDAAGAAQDTANDAQGSVQGAVDEAQGTAQGAASDLTNSGAGGPSGGATSRHRANQDGAPDDLSDLVAGGHSIEGTFEASVDATPNRDDTWEIFGWPVTGAELLAVAGVGLLFISAGAVLWRKARSRPAARRRERPVPHT